MQKLENHLQKSKVKRKWLWLTALGLLLFSGISMNYSASKTGLTIYINGKYATEDLIVKDNITYVPLRMCSETLKAQVNWDANAQAISIVKGEQRIGFTVGEKTIMVNGEIKNTTSAPLIIKNVTYVPFRNLFEGLNTVVDYKNYGAQRQFISVYETHSDFYKQILKTKSDDLMTRRMAMVASPRIGYAEGVRLTQYLFPLNENANYFFVMYEHTEGEYSGMAYYEVVDGYAVNKWQREYKQPSQVTGKHPVLNYLGESTEVVVRYGEFPQNISNQYVKYYNNHWMGFEIDEAYVKENMKPYEIVDILNNEGIKGIAETTKGSFLYGHTSEKIFYYLTSFDESKFVQP